MPLKLNVGLSKKIGLPDYGSLGASCHVEVELDRSLLEGDLDRFHQHVRQAFTACGQAVDDELVRQQVAGNCSTMRAPQAPEAVREAPHGALPSPSSNGSGTANGHRISEKQLNYARQLAGKIRGLGVARLDQVAGRMFGKTMADLSSLEASGLIDTLKAVKGGDVSLDAVVQGAAA